MIAEATQTTRRSVSSDSDVALRARSIHIRKVAVLGAGTMGSRIAAHFANAGVSVVLLDIPHPGCPGR
jgi:glutamyl-tRNA reductase